MRLFADWETKVPDSFLAEIEIRPVTAPTSPEFAQCVALYEESFPEGERETCEAIQTWLTAASQDKLVPDNYHILAAIDISHDRVCGVVLFHYLGAIGCGFIGYLAVDASCQSRGLGSTLLQEVPEVLRRDAQRMGHALPSGLLTELDKERAEDPATYARFRFWQRHGFLPLELDWRYPRLHNGEPPTAMYLAHASIGLCAGWPPLTEQRALEIVTAIYQGVYHRGVRDPDLALVLKSIKGRQAIQGRTILNPQSMVPPNPVGRADENRKQRGFRRSPT